MKPPLSNTELVTEIMDFSPHGALASMFVMTALANYAGRIASLDADELEKHFENSFVSGPAWQGCAREILERLNNR